MQVNKLILFTLPHLGGSLKDSELLRVRQRSIKRHHHHLRAAIREVLGNVSTGFGHRFNLLLTSQEHEDVLRRGCFLEPEEKASEKLQQIGEGGRTDDVTAASLPRCPGSRSLKHVQKKGKTHILCELWISLKIPVDSAEVKGNSILQGSALTGWRNHSNSYIGFIK